MVFFPRHHRTGDSQSWVVALPGVEEIHGRGTLFRRPDPADFLSWDDYRAAVLGAHRL